MKLRPCKRHFLPCIHIYIGHFYEGISVKGKKNINLSIELYGEVTLNMAKTLKSRNRGSVIQCCLIDSHSKNKQRSREAVHFL